MSKQKINCKLPAVCICQYASSTSKFPQTLISCSFPKDKASRERLDNTCTFWDILPTAEIKLITKQSYLTCETKGAFAGVLWGRWWLTCCNACGSIQTAFWFNQAGIADILAKLSNPSWGTNTLQENSIVVLIYLIRCFFSPFSSHRGACLEQHYVFIVFCSISAHWISG